MKNEKVNLKLGAIISGITLILMLILSAYAWSCLPSDASLPVHWGMSGNPDRFTSKTEALLAMPVSTLTLSFVLGAVPLLEPRKKNLAKSGKAYIATWSGVMILLLVAHICIVLSGLSINVPVVQVISVAMGLLFVVIGNFMGKVKSNYYFGVRTPWTLESEYSWRKTHRLTGWLFVILGLSIAILSIFVNSFAIFIYFIAGSFVVTAISIVYSYEMWKQDPARKEMKGDIHHKGQVQ